jgi:hypothetical protein
MNIQRSTLLTLAGAAIGLLASCYPLPDEPPQTQAQNAQQPSVSSEEQQRIQEQRDKMRQEQERQQAQQNAPRETPPPTSEPRPRSDYPFATPVPGKEGFVFSPFSDNKIVDARGIPSGTLVQDPTFPTEKKYFRVP